MPKTCTSCGTTYPDTMVFCPADGTTLRLDESGGDLVGTVIADRYLVSKLLGEGGMGKVYLARHVRLPQQAAIKVLHHDMVRDAGAVARFNREAANAARIEHDRVARVFDFGETSEGIVYIAMEFVPGMTLRDLIDKETRLDPVRAANIVYQVGEGLEAAHRLSIVHRDLKPDNILVTTDDLGVDRCKVVDFGIAKVTDKSAEKLTQTGMIVGTPEFMSPEQAMGEELDGRSDVYALALVAYEMFTGNLPFDGSTPERKLTARLIQEPKPLAVVASEVAWPQALQDAMDHALQRDPPDRTASAMEFADAVVNAVEAWTGMSVMRARTPMSNTAITNAANSYTPRVNTAVQSTEHALPSASVRTPSVGPSAKAGAGAAAATAPVSTVAPKKSPMMAMVALAVIVLGGGGYFAYTKFAGSGTAAAPQTSAAADTVHPTPPGTPNTPPSKTSQSANAPTNAGASGVKSPSPNPTPTAAQALAAANQASLSAPPSEPATTVAGLEAQKRLTELKRDVARAVAEVDDDSTKAAASAKAIVPELKTVLSRLTTRVDSTWAYINLVFALGVSGEPASACPFLIKANALANTTEQRSMVEEIIKEGTFPCRP